MQSGHLIYSSYFLRILKEEFSTASRCLGFLILACRTCLRDLFQSFGIQSSEWQHSEALPGWEVTAASLRQPCGRNHQEEWLLRMFSAWHWMTSTLSRGRGYAIGVQPLSKFMDQEEAPPIGEREQEMERGRRVLPGEWGGVPINTPSLSVLWTHWSSSWSLRITGCDQPLKGRKQHFIQEATLPKLTIHPLWVFHEPVLLVWTFLKMLWNGSKERIISINSWAKTPSLFF